MNLSIDKKGAVVIVKVEEEYLNIKNFMEFIAQISEIYEKEGKVNIAVDLQNVRILGDEGVGALVGALKKALEHHCILNFCCLQPQVISLLKQTRLDRVFEIFPTQQEAIASFLSDEPSPDTSDATK